MNFSLHWLLIYSYRNGLISRKEFVALWEIVYQITEISKDLPVCEHK